MSIKKKCIIAILSFFSFVIIKPDDTYAQSSPNYRIKKSVIAQGGAASQSTNYETNDVIGQASPVSDATSTDYTVSAGFLGGVVSIASAVEEMDEPAIPAEYILHQNYPNPFNPVTTIRFSLPKPSKVLLVIYNLAGQEVTSLIIETKPPGEYEVQWNASNLPSGIYVCQMQAE